VPAGVAAFVGEDTIPDRAFADLDLLVLSPGVPPAPFLDAHARLAPGAEVHGEMSLSLAVAEDRWGRLPTVLITGTNGKSTVTALTGALLTAAGQRPFVGGNLGVPLAHALRTAERPDSLVLECSSFQLETLAGAAVDVAMVLNLTPDHLDRYPTLEAYAETKARIFADLAPDGLALLDGGDPWTPFFQARVPRGRPSSWIAWPLGQVPKARSRRSSGPGPGHTLALPAATTTRAPPSASPAATTARTPCSPSPPPATSAPAHDACLAGLAAFEGLPHRMVLVRELAGVTYYDDSKATNVASVLASLGGFDRRFVLIAGGRAKGDDLAPLRALLARAGAGLVAIGESTDPSSPSATASCRPCARPACPPPSPPPVSSPVRRATPSCSRPRAPATTGLKITASAATCSPPASAKRRLDVAREREQTPVEGLQFGDRRVVRRGHEIAIRQHLTSRGAGGRSQGLPPRSRPLAPRRGGSGRRRLVREADRLATRRPRGAA
jgi:UDP-N-acetylmuramoylalanine--D-glutamate ligase